MVLSLSWLTTLSLGVVTVTGIITPLGLSDRVEPISPRAMPFVYAPDKSAFGLVTPPRPDMPFSRQCGGIAALSSVLDRRGRTRMSLPAGRTISFQAQGIIRHEYQAT